MISSSVSLQLTLHLLTFRADLFTSLPLRSISNPTTPSITMSSVSSYSSTNSSSQSNECEFLQSVFCQPGEFILDTSDQIDDAASSVTSSSATSSMRFRIQLQFAIDTPSDVSLTLELDCSLPSNYPTSALPELYIRSVSPIFDLECSRRCNELLNGWMESLKMDGEPIIYAATEFLRESLPPILTSAAERYVARASTKMTAATSSTSTSSGVVTFQREWIVFHHIYSRMKRREILSQAIEHSLTGVVKNGKPGICIIEGEESDVQNWLTRIRSLNWQKMSTKLTERIVYENGTIPCTQSQRSTFLTQQRKFDTFIELKPLPGQQWCNISQLMEVLIVRGMDSTIRDIIGLSNTTTGSDDVDDATNSDIDDDAAATPTTVVKQLDKRSLKAEQKRTAAAEKITAVASHLVASSSPSLSLKCVEVIDTKSTKQPSSKKSPTPSSVSSSVIDDLLLDVRLHIRVQPNCSQTEIVDMDSENSILNIRLHAPPREGEANKEVRRFCKEIFGLSLGQIELIAGEKAREKTLLLRQVRARDICATILAHCSSSCTSGKDGKR